MSLRGLKTDLAKPKLPFCKYITSFGLDAKNSLGYTSWTTVFSTKPFEMVQCDFSYMISPDQFDEFIKPTIVEQCKRIPRTIFHIDGPGVLNHLDSILSIEELDGIQWIPGAG